MSNTLQIKRGLQVNLPTGLAGELLFTTDTKRLYISDGAATNLIQGASTLLTTGAVPFSDANGKITMDATKLYWDNTNKRLGIGTATPGYALDVNSTSRITQSNAGNTPNLILATPASNLNLKFFVDQIAAYDNATSSALYLNYNGGDIGLGGTKATLKYTTGNFLIGTTTDGGSRLQVKGSGTTSATTTLLAQNSAGTQLLKVFDDGEVQAGGSTSTQFKVMNTAGLSISRDASLNANIRIREFGTSGPYFQMNGNSGPVFKMYDNSNFACILSHSTWTGIGKGVVENTTAALQVDSTTKGFLGPRMTTTERNAIVTPATGLSIYNTTTNTQDYYNGTSWIQLQVSGSGLSGSGTTNYIPKFTGTSSIGNSLIYDNGTNVLIGTTTDAGYKLQVNGDAYINTLRIGLGAGSIASNTVLGYNALSSNTTGNRTVAIGKEALFVNTASNNTAVGNQALYSNTTGGTNTAVGDVAMRSNTTGEQNTALGYTALYSSVSGNENVSIGYQSLFNSTASRNVAIGANALLANTTGERNTAIGYSVSSGNNSGSVILGHGAAASASNQFVVGSAAVNAGQVVNEVNTSTKYWEVVINGVICKVLLA